MTHSATMLPRSSKQLALGMSSLIHLTSVGCDQPMKSTPAASAAVTAELSGSSSLSAQPILSSSASSAAAPKEAPAPSPIPDIPGGESPKPTPEEWAAAPAVNTGATGYVAPDCMVRVVREWVAPFCKDGHAYAGITYRNLGRPGVDWFEGWGATGVHFRLRPGEVQQVSLAVAHATLTAAWPKASAKPIYLAVERVSPDRQVGGNVIPLPVVPTEDTVRPEPALWYGAPRINDAPEGARPAECAMQLLTNWVRVYCVNKDLTYPRVHIPTNLGELKKDYFILDDTSRSELIVRIRPGADMSANIQWYEVQDARFRAQWPSGAEKPTISLELVR